MNEQPFYFNSGNNQLFGILHKPLGQSQKTGYVFCSPFAEEKLWSQRVLVNFARKLASSGYTVLRFDYFGHGDSDGDFSDSTVETRIKDIIAAVDILQKKEERLEKTGLLGLRFGATLAALTAERGKNINQLILWEPILQGPKYMKSLFRINITTQTAVYKEVRFNSDTLVNQLQQGKSVSIEGYDLMLPLYEQIMDIDIAESSKSFSSDALIMQIVKREGQSSKVYEKFSKTFSNANLRSAVEKQFWKEIKEYYYVADHLFDATIHWLKEKNE